MKFKVLENSFEFIPDIADNLKEEPEKQFKIILTKVNQTLKASEYAKYEVNGIDASGKPKIEMTSLDDTKFYRDHVKRFVNAPIIENEKGETKEITPDDLFSNKYVSPVLDSLLEQIIIKIGNLRQDADEKVKK